MEWVVIEPVEPSLLQLQSYAIAQRAGGSLRTRQNAVTTQLVCHWATATSLLLRSRLGDQLSELPVRERRLAYLTTMRVSMPSRLYIIFHQKKYLLYKVI